MSVSLEVVNGVGPAMAEMLKSNGFNSVEDLANTSVETLVDLPGFGPARATQIILRANEALAHLEAETAEVDLNEPESAEDTAEAAEYEEAPEEADTAAETTAVSADTDDEVPAAEEIPADAADVPEPTAAPIEDPVEVSFAAAEDETDTET